MNFKPTNPAPTDSEKENITAKPRQKNYSIVIALGLAVILCGAFVFFYSRVYGTTQENLIHTTQDKITLISETTTSFLQTAKTVVATDAGNIEYIIKDGGSNTKIKEFLLYQTDFELEKIDPSFTGVYGLYRGEYLDGNGWDPYAEYGEYHPTERPWYIAAKDGQGEVSVASPYLDMDTGNTVLSITKMLSDGESVIGMDISLKDLSDYLTEYLAGDNFVYAYIVDKSGTVVASKDATEIGLNYFDGDKSETEMAEIFRKAFSSDEVFDYRLGGRRQLIVSDTIENDWQIIAIADATFVLLPLYLIAVLCIVLLAGMIGLLVFFAVSSFANNKKNVIAQHNEQKYVSELKDSADQLSSYKRAILSDALIALEVNLTKDDLYYGIWKDDDGVEVPLNDIIGLNTPCSYDQYIKIWNNRFVKTDSKYSFSGSTDREYLLDIFNSGKSEVTFDYEAKTISGKSRWLRRSITMAKNTQGDIIAYTSVKDISALVFQTKREETYIRALATEYDSITVVNFDEDKTKDKVVLHSRITKELKDLLDDETVNEVDFIKKIHTLANFIHPDDRETFLAETKREIIFQSFDDDTPHSITFRLQNKGGENSIYYRMSFVPLKEEDGKLVGMIVSLRNINEEITKELGIRRELENAMVAAEAASQAKTTFLFNMSHDIRTPMNAIIGFTDIAEKHIDDTERVKDSLGKVKFASEHLLSLINDVLDMSRVESGRVKIEEEPVLIDTAKDNLYSILVGSAEAKNVLFTSTLSPSIEHHWIYADRLRLMRVLTNVVSNSVKYTNPGGKINLLTEEIPCHAPKHARMRYTVTDTGIGMSKEFLTHVFEPFSRAESATRSGVVGTGLGMAITKSLVELMGGTIEIESELGVGTTVRIEIEHRIAEPVAYDIPTDDDITAKLNGKKILLVEDNELNREIATEILQEEGVIVEIAEDGDVAVEKMRNATLNQYDLILMDIQMPRMNGYEATRAIRTLPNAYASGIPIVAMTANAFEEDKQNAMAAGMNAHVAKPIDVPKLIKVLTEFLK